LNFSPPGACITPSMDTNSVTTSLPILHPPSRVPYDRLPLQKSSVAPPDPLRALDARVDQADPGDVRS
jgi:hypothetical protein